MDMTRGGVADHRRDRETGRLVYPVLSRRSGGLSLGINLFPETKSCTFDCPYCEVFPFESAVAFSLLELRLELADFLDRIYPAVWASVRVRDLCISGNGEPSLSPLLGEVLELCAETRRSYTRILGAADLVLITNSTGFLSPSTAELLHRAVAKLGLVVWAKLDGGTEETFHRMSRSSVPFASLVESIASFALQSPIILQTMLCKVGDRAPADEEVLAYADLVAGLIAGGAKIKGIQLYTQARPAPETITAPLSDAELTHLAWLVRSRVVPPAELAPAPGAFIRAFGAAEELADVRDPAR